ncbi:hypothetical protein O1611_g7272 [Lasiodiplodia mahajangana]|uniref:Uncharacterized protein n=1 Tax=Lasiodiplodia mahajangana TaxID=1108764 RepID=A0ACC2JFR5_9PEZI|nr:hypothetical protein O1611_g7272 [Lasiodiplodia mahajangana]
MDAIGDIPDRTLSANNTCATDDGGEEVSLSPFPAALPSDNPRATVPEGLSSATMALPLPTCPSPPTPAPIVPLRSSARTHLASALLRGPVPIKGSGQDRFRQLLKKTEDSGSTSMVRNNPFAVSTSTVQRPLAAQPFSPGVTTVGPSPFTLHATAFTHPDIREMDRTVAAPSGAVAEMSSTVKTEIKDSSLTQPKAIIGEAHGQSHRQPVNAGGGTQHHPLATARLSAQCQLRRFNPKWHETSGQGGFKCSVQLINKIIHGEHAYPTPNEAKQAVAEKALVYVRHLPVEDPAEKAAMKIASSGQTDRHCDRSRQGRAQVNREPTATGGHANFHGQHAYPTSAGANAPVYTWNAYNYTDQRTFLHRVQSIFGAGGPSPAVLSDPLAAQAFLQGLALGTSARAVSSTYDPYLESQGRPLPTIPGEVCRRYNAREQSPRRNFSRSYRDRSPLRRRSP